MVAQTRAQESKLQTSGSRASAPSTLMATMLKDSKSILVVALVKIQGSVAPSKVCGFQQMTYLTMSSVYLIVS
jgi:hypothetical protein